MTCTVKSVCDEMAAETDREIFMCDYNTLIENVNAGGHNKTEDDEACVRTLAAKFNADIQNGLNKQTSIEMHQDMTSLVTTVEDSSVVSNMKRAQAIFWLIFACILLLVVIYLWNFK